MNVSSPSLPANAKRALSTTGSETSADLSAGSSTKTMDAIQERPSDPFPAPLFTTVQHKKIKRRKVATNGEPSSMKSLDEVLTSIVPSFDNSEKKLSLNFHEFSDLINFSYSLNATHSRTRLLLKAKGHLKEYRSEIIELISNASYQRSYSPEEIGGLLLRANYHDSEIEVERRSNGLLRYLHARYYPRHPTYVINGSAINGDHLDVSGALLLDLQTKLIEMMLNYTPGATYLA
ncbi:hypothetical protein QAD02_007124 [Eretmocerus hayati]|uniref:Uncharacterized protein n=1 Tax=Eretmocerus hayati TaxID=131215 RepID=A0ACC2N2U1_9HYME|nr:hypothetical protein QAD02_007124 [Eretmocerus hayati]